MVFNEFLTNTDLYSEDMRQMAAKTIERYGLSEWRACVLTNELHGHLGIYAVAGAKMGIFALEQLEAEAGTVNIVSSAGLRPPVSCMNDGLQVSTGATLGHGMISSPATDNPVAEAVFSTKKRSVRIKIKDSIQKMITNEIKDAVRRWGDSPGYWDAVRKVAIRYWYELDRNDIFENRWIE